jgi:hypothetical protein
MKKLIYTLALFLTLNFAFLIQNSQAQWVQMSSGIPQGSLTTIGSLGEFVFVGTMFYGVMYSANYGVNWTQNSFNDKTVNCFATLGTTIYAGTSNFGVYKSTNNCITWTQTALSNKNVFSLAVNGNNIFAGTDNEGIWLSTNAGTTWTQTAQTDKYILSLVSYSTNVIAGTLGTGIYVSSNNGASWSQSIADKTVRSIVRNGSYLFASIDGNIYFPGGVYVSVNNGITWTPTQFNKTSCRSLTLSGTKIYAGTEGYGVSLSLNNGASWVDVSQGYQGGTTCALTSTNSYLFLADLPQGVYRRALLEIGIKNISTEIPSAYSLSQNYPNPFNPSTKIRFEIPSLEGYVRPGGRGVGMVSLKVYDIMGREIATLVNEQLAPGTYETTFDGSALSSGTYFYKLTTGDFSQTKRMLLVK